VRASDKALDRLDRYIALLAHWSRSIRLVGSSDLQSLVAHALDAAALLRLPLPQGLLIDLGSGAGLPGIPIAAIDSERPVWLVEPRLRRSVFLERAVSTLSLSHVRVMRTRLEQLSRPAEGTLCVARALAPPARLLPMVAEAGFALAIVMTTARAEPEQLPAQWAMVARDEPPLPGPVSRVNILCRLREEPLPDPL
jgi:16S rRNA (guanine527-N7)-methyltransferase